MLGTVAAMWYRLSNGSCHTNSVAAVTVVVATAIVVATILVIVMLAVTEA